MDKSGLSDVLELHSSEPSGDEIFGIAQSLKVESEQILVGLKQTFGSHLRPEDSSIAPPKPVTPKWTNGAMKRLATKMAFPLVYVLNRPRLQFLAEMAYDFALRLNGYAINFPGRHGVGCAEERFLARHLPTVSKGVLFDIGANHGSYLMEMRRLAPEARIYAFEPHPKTFASLQDRAGSSGATLVNMAVSDTPGMMQLHDFADGDGSTQASLAQASVGMYDARTVAHEVMVTTLDAYMDQAGIPSIDFLKIDTEGFDINVLRGAKQALARRAIKAIQFEIIPADIAMRVTVRDFFEVLQGFRLHRLCLNGELLPLLHYNVKRCEVYVTHNIVALLD